ncbi:MAG: hypothetical protein LBI57_02560 [Helicobacteraceae bacterium]|nr:hypothetical protein [Helicobacteraceae bacterium]
MKPQTQVFKSGINVNTATVKRVSTLFQYPVFSFKEIKRGYGVDECNKDAKASLALKLSKIGSLAWIELQQADRHGLGCEKIAKSAIKAETNFIPSDALLIAFRFYGKAPMIGYRCNLGVFHIVWLDRDLTLYKH